MKLLSFSYNDDCSTAAIRAYYGHSTHDMPPVTQRVPRPSYTLYHDRHTHCVTADVQQPQALYQTEIIALTLQTMA